MRTFLPREAKRRGRHASKHPISPPTNLSHRDAQKAQGPANPQRNLERPFCYLCERDFDDNRTLSAVPSFPAVERSSTTNVTVATDTSADSPQIHMQRFHEEQLTKITTPSRGAKMTISRCSAAVTNLLRVQESATATPSGLRRSRWSFPSSS